MFRRISQIKNVKIGFTSNNEFAVLPKNDSGFVVYNCIEKTEKEISLSFALQEAISLNGNLFVITDNYHRSGIIYKIDETNNVNIFRDISNYVVTGKMGNYLNIQIIENKKGKIGEIRWLPAIYNWKEDRLLWQKNYGINFVSYYIIAKTNHSEYSRLSIDTGEIIWSYSFADYPKTKNIHGKEESVSVHDSAKAFTGVIDNKLWVSLNTSQHLVLDIDTGEQIALLGQPYKYNKDYYAQKVMSGGQIDEKQNKIISLGNCQYREINTDTFEATFIDLREEFDKYGVSSVGDTRFDDNYIYFYDKIFFGDQPRNKVAVLDRHTLKVVWVHDFAQYGTFPMQMEKTDRHLFVLDSGGTLHIFEREEVA